MPRLAIVAMLAAVLAFPVAGVAQGWNSFSNPASRSYGASVCPIDQVDSAGRYLCFELSCDAGRELGFRLNAKRTNMPDRVEATVVVGNRVAATIEFERTPPVQDYMGLIEKYHFDGLRRMQAGNRAELRIWQGRGHPTLRYPMSLRGSRVAIQAVLDACALPDFAARKITDNPLGQIEGRIKRTCDDLGGTMSRGEGLVRALEMNGDGQPDLVINYGSVICSAARTLVCGSAGCLHSLWIGLGEGRYREIWANNIHGLAVIDRGVVRIAFHGSACGLVGAAPCSKTFRVLPDRLEPID